MKIISTVLLIVTVATLFLFSTPKVSAKEILKDTQFANGFSPCWWAGTDFLAGVVRGLCRGYRDTPGYIVKVIPGNDPAKSVEENNKDKYWEFNEGAHQNYTDENGNHVTELFPYHLTVNHDIITNNPSNLTFIQKNPSTGATVKKVITDKNGKIQLSFNTKNEIRNIADHYSSLFATDTWPHFALSQLIPDRTVDLEYFDKIQTTADIKINKWNILPGWPYATDTNSVSPEMTLNLGVFIREKAIPKYGVFAGVRLFHSKQNYAAYGSTDQWGQGFFWDDVRLYGGPPVVGNKTRITFDLLPIIEKALTGSGKSINDYYLSEVGFGYEGIGWFDGEFVMENLSMDGIEKYPTVSRLEAAGILTREFALNAPLPAISTFADIALTNPERSSIETLYQKGITYGCSQSPKLFCPYLRFTRAESAAMLLRIAGKTPDPSDSTPRFADTPATHPLFGYVQLFHKLGFTSGCTQTPRNYCPDLPISQNDFDTFIARVKNSMITPTPTPVPGDLTDTEDTPGDQVNIYDYNKLLSLFGNPYTIYEYNALLANFGR